MKRTKVNYKTKVNNYYRSRKPPLLPAFVFVHKQELCCAKWNWLYIAT